jgi:NADH-quinone oxidoreductase subunit L
VVNDAVTASYLRLIPLLPLCGALIHGLTLGLNRRPLSKGLTNLVSCGAVIAAFAVSCFAVSELLQLPEGQRRLVDDLYTWIGAGVGREIVSAEMALVVDPLSAVMILVVTGVGSLIHIYSIGYMEDDHRDDKGYPRFFAYLNLFTFSMLCLVLGENLLLLFVGWEGVGLCSYLLIGFWYSDRWNAYCGSKAFIVNRIGDFGFLLGIFVLFSALVDAGSPTLSFAGIQAAFHQISAQTLVLPLVGEIPLVDVAGICFFLGAAGKSAQIPLYVWLPDAMAGPTPVSALIHAATMVTAGVYMVCRLSFLYAEAEIASALIAWVGGLTAFFAATIGIAQTDIKKVLAYSTVSQLGYMFLAAGCGAYGAAIFHLGTHAFFKALLFLGSGSVILAMHHEQDIEKMGGLFSKIPVTAWTFLVGVLAIAGTPGLSGFFSKDEILVAAYTARVPGHETLYLLALATAGITSFYMFRLFFRTFTGECRASAEVQKHIHEPGASVLFPLCVLALLSVVGGYVGLPQVWGDLVGVANSNWLAGFLAPVLAHGEAHHLDHATEYAMAGAAIGSALIGFALAFLMYYARPAWSDALARALAAPHRLLVNKYWIDELYDALFVRPTVFLSERVLFRFVDAGVIDGFAVNGSAKGVRALAAHGLRHLHSGLAQSYVFFMIAGAVAIVGYLLR